MPQTFAEEENSWNNWEDESKITVSIIGSSIIDLDSSNRLIRAYVDIVNFDPSDGRYIMKIIQPTSEKIISEKEIVIREKSNGEAGSDVAYMINTDEITSNGTAVLGDYMIEILSDKGSAIGGTIFSVIDSTKPSIISNSNESHLSGFTEDNDESNESEVLDEQIESDNVIENIQQIPDWVKNIFILYANGDITEKELLSALTFLIDQEIILVNK